MQKLYLAGFRMNNKEKVKEALRIVNKSIESMKIKDMDMSTGAGVWWKLDMEKIKKLLEK